LVLYIGEPEGEGNVLMDIGADLTNSPGKVKTRGGKKLGKQEQKATPPSAADSRR